MSPRQLTAGAPPANFHFEINLSQFPQAASGSGLMHGAAHRAAHRLRAWRIVAARAPNYDAARKGTAKLRPREGDLPRPEPPRKLIATKSVWLRSNKRVERMRYAP
jgi:hypothetical protein